MTDFFCDECGQVMTVNQMSENELELVCKQCGLSEREWVTNEE